MHQTVRQAFFLGLILSSPGVGHGQERDHPILHTIGRYFGIGYTKGGYHAVRDGRPNFIANNHRSFITDNYAMSLDRGGDQQYLNHNTTPEQSVDLPIAVDRGGGQPYVNPPRYLPLPLNAQMPSETVHAKPGGFQPAQAGEAAVTIHQPPQASGIPPQWFETYLNNGTGAESDRGAPHRESESIELKTNSPSDRTLDEAEDQSIPSEEVSSRLPHRVTTSHGVETRSILDGWPSLPPSVPRY